MLIAAYDIVMTAAAPCRDTNTRICTLLILYENVVLYSAQAEYSYFSDDFSLKIFLYYCLSSTP